MISLEQDIEKILRAEHYDPFQVLGAHPLPASPEGEERCIVRAFLPDARAVFVILRDGKEKKLDRVKKPGLFETVINRRDIETHYKLRAVNESGFEKTFVDPYTFLPLLSDYDRYLFNQGKHHFIYEKLGSHVETVDGIEGTVFRVWAPNALRMSVVGEFNNWDGRVHMMRVLGSSGIWELFIPGIGEGALYKFEIKPQNGAPFVKSDPYAFYSERRPKTASIVYKLGKHKWMDEKWQKEKERTNPFDLPMTIYEVHLGSWKKPQNDPNSFFNYREIAVKLVDYVKELGYTHIELLPIMAHPLDSSWGYQVSGYYEPTARYGKPEDLMFFVDYCHQNSIGVILDWVPAHFPKDAHALGGFDGTHLYEHADPRKGEHKDWGTLVFNYGRNEVKNFLISNALFWLKEYHFDGLRVDAVASMLYLDYSRADGEWIPNEYGGRENLEAIAFLKELNEVVYSYFPKALMVAEESTAWPAVTKPTYLGGLGFSFKWNMGWMNDTLSYFSTDPIYRKYHHNNLTFAIMYAFYENFILPLSHDEVVHGKKSLLSKMPGDEWQQFANVRLLFTYMYGHPGKKLSFMGNEIGQREEWNHAEELHWDILNYPYHRGLQRFIRDLNKLYRQEKSMWQIDFDYTGFEWIDFHDADNSIISFMRKSKDPKDFLLFVYNFTPVVREKYKIGAPRHAFYREILNSDSEYYGGSNVGNGGGIMSVPKKYGLWPCYLELTLPPLAGLILKPEQIGDTGS